MIKKLHTLIMDIDNTLVEKGKMIMPITKQALITLHNRGVKIGLASGRPVNASMKNYYKDWDLPFQFDVLIGMNGGELYTLEHPETVHFYPMQTQDIKAVVESVKELDMIGQIYEDDMMVVTKWDASVEKSMIRNRMEVLVSPLEDRLYRKDNAKIQFRYDPKRVDEVVAFCNSLTLLSHIQCVSTSEGIIEFMDDRVNKGVAVEEYAKRYNVPMDTIMAFGDLQNDNEMLEIAGWGVCMANGDPHTKQCANDITDDPVWDDGMGKYLEKKVIGTII